MKLEHLAYGTTSITCTKIHSINQNSIFQITYYDKAEISIQGKKNQHKDENGKQRFYVHRLLAYFHKRYTSRFRYNKVTRLQHSLIIFQPISPHSFRSIPPDLQQRDAKCLNPSHCHPMSSQSITVYLQKICKKFPNQSGRLFYVPSLKTSILQG